MNPKTGQTAVSLRSTIEEVPGHVLCLAKEGQLFPKDDTEDGWNGKMWLTGLGKWMKMGLNLKHRGDVVGT